MLVDVGDDPGLISFDGYWTHVENDPSLKANPSIREVRNKFDILQTKIQGAFSKKVYIPLALRIIRALAVHRLTTGISIPNLVLPRRN